MHRFIPISNLVSEFERHPRVFQFRFLAKAEEAEVDDVLLIVR